MCGCTSRGNRGPGGDGRLAGGTVYTLCNRSRRDALMGERVVSNAGKVGSVATTA